MPATCVLLGISTDHKTLNLTMSKPLNGSKNPFASDKSRTYNVGGKSITSCIYAPNRLTAWN